MFIFLERYFSALVNANVAAADFKSKCFQGSGWSQYGWMAVLPLFFRLNPSRFEALRTRQEKSANRVERSRMYLAGGMAFQDAPVLVGYGFVLVGRFVGWLHSKANNLQKLQPDQSKSWLVDWSVRLDYQQHLPFLGWWKQRAMLLAGERHEWMNGVEMYQC